MIWFCALGRSASSDDWLYAQMEWHTLAPENIDLDMRENPPWCPLCSKTEGLYLDPHDPAFCGYLRTATPSAMVIERVDGRWPEAAVAALMLDYEDPSEILDVLALMFSTEMDGVM